jgi:hypothetical protein
LMRSSCAKSATELNMAAKAIDLRIIIFILGL